MKIYRVSWEVRGLDEDVLSSGAKAFLDGSKAKDMESKLREAASTLLLNGRLVMRTTHEEVTE